MSYSQEAQEAILGAVLSGQIDSADVPLEAIHFHGRQHQTLWETCRKMSDRGMVADMISVVDHLPEDSPLLEDQGVDYITSLAEDAKGVTPGVLETYSKLVRDHWARRHLQSGMMDAIDAVQTDDIDSVVAQLDSLTQEIDEADSEYAAPEKQVLNDLVDRIDQRHQSGVKMNGLTTGLIDLDENTDGLQNSDLVILAARPSQGKTAFALGMIRAAMHHTPVAFFSLEMPTSKILDRMVTAEAKINFKAVKRGMMEQRDFDSFAVAVQNFHNAKFRIDDRSYLTPAMMRSACKRYKKEMGGLGLIVVDYLQLMAPGKKMENETLSIGYISSQLKRLAKDFDCPVVALSQLNRGVEARPNKRPRNSDLRQSGSIEQDADLIMFLYRDEVYDKNTSNPGICEVIIGKAREGEIGTVYTAWQGHFQRFDNLAPGSVNDGE